MFTVFTRKENIITMEEIMFKNTIGRFSWSEGGLSKSLVKNSGSFVFSNFEPSLLVLFTSWLALSQYVFILYF